MRTNTYQQENYSYGTSQYVTMNQPFSYGAVPTQSISSVNRYVPSSGSNLRNSKVTRKTVYGEKYDYGEKVKEKHNYLLYVSGTLREKKEIEEIEQLPSEPKFLEEKEIIDNYQYHESKNLKKQNPNRLSITQHKRLSSPFEKTTIRAVTDDGAPYQYGTRTISTKQQRYCSVPKTTNVHYEKYETYQPQKKYNYQKRYGYTPINRTEKKEIYQQRRTKIPLGDYETNVNDYYQYRPQNEYYEEKIKTINNTTTPYKINKYNLNDGNTKTETRQEGEYLVKTTVTKKTIDNRNFNTIDNSNVKNYRNIRNNVNEEDYGDNYRYYESKNVRKVGRINRPVTYHSRRRGSEEKTSNYSKNLRNVNYQSNQSYNYGRGGYEESRTFEQRRVKNYGNYGNFVNKDFGNDNQFKYLRGRETTGKYETYEEIVCPIHGRQTVRKEYCY